MAAEEKAAHYPVWGIPTQAVAATRICDLRKSLQ
jgi:hypothetical protein